MSEQSRIIHQNTPKGIGADGKADVPSAYLVKQLTLVNSNGASFDISSLVTSFTITEELASPVVVINLRIRDTINFFEDFSLSGQEKIVVDLTHITKHDSDRSLNLVFAVKEYPNYQKSLSEPNVQEYNIIGVSRFGYESMLSRISRSVKGNPLSGIERIYKEDLGVGVKILGTCASVFDGIITVQSPMKAAEWLRSKAFDVAGSPFFIYSNISEADVVSVTSLSELVSSRNSVFREYTYRQYLANPAQTLEAYKENASRILDMRSNIKLDKLSQAIRGGFASSTSVTDVGTKTFTSLIFNQGEDESSGSNRIGGGLRELFNPRNPANRVSPLSELPNASISNISTNTTAIHAGNPNSSTGPVRDNISRAKSYLANLEGVSHQIQVYGDFSLNPGRKIAIRIPKSINVEEYTRNNPNSDSSDLDQSLSGDYLVSVVAHTFSSGIYTSKLKIIKDA